MNGYSINEVTELLCHFWQAGLRSDMKCRRAHGFVLCRESEFSFFCDGREIVADKSHILFLPKSAHYSFVCRKSGLTYTYNFEGSLPFSEPYCVEIADNSRCLAVAEEMQKKDGDFAKIGLMYRIFGYIFDKNSLSDIPEIIRPQVEYIQKSFGNGDISNEFLASMTNISEVYLRKLFVRHLGVSPHEYISGVRIENAKRLLAEGKNVSETASLCGFSSLYYFSAAFGKRVGTSPSEFSRHGGSI